MLKITQKIQEQITDLKTNLVHNHKKCGGSGYLPGESEGLVSRCSCMIIFRYLSKLIKSGIPTEYWNLSFDELKIDTSIKNKLDIYINNIRKAKQKGLGVIFQGNNGVGKTSISCEIGKIAIIAGFSVKYFTLSNYINSVFTKLPERDIITYYKSSDFLIIDEIDKCNSKVRNIVEDFFRYASNNNKCLVCSSNLDLEGLEDLLGKSTISLFRRKNMFITMIGNDYSLIMEQSFEDRLTNSIDYFASNIWSKALLFDQNN